MLSIGLIQLQQISTQNALTEKERLSLLLGTEEVYANLGKAVESGQVSGPVDLSKQKLSYTVPKTTLNLSADFSDQSSQNRPLPTNWSTFDNISKRGVPEFSFFSDDEHAKSNTLPLGHTRLELTESAHHSTSLAVFSHTFPYGLYAPNGSIEASTISSFSNPIEYESNQEISEESGRPVDICALNNIIVSDYYSSGRAFSQSGTVSLPQGADAPGAVGFSGHPNPKNPWTDLASNLSTLGNQIASGALDKTEFLDDELFTLAHLKDIFSGNASDLISIFGVGQACKVPFFPIPAVQDDAPLLFVFYIHHPYPVDFSGVARDSDDSERLKEIGQELDEKQAELVKKQKELEEEEGKKDPDQSKVDSLKGDISDLKSDIESLKKEAKDLSDKISREGDDLKKKLSASKVPETAVEDAEQVTTGWAYLYIIGDLVQIVFDLVSGKNPLDDIFIPTRVVHLGGSDPGWEWEEDKIDMKANLTVPPGRTLKITKSEVSVRGDIYLQKGALLTVDGNLSVERPSSWSDFKGVDTVGVEGYPKGRVIIEEGASLVVSGDLNVNGGTYHEGSVLVSSAYGPNKAITRLIQAGGNINLKYGISPVVTLGDLVDELGKDDSSLKGFNDDFFTPLIEDVFPVIGKLPYVGSWQWRPSWFAKYATTFEFVPLLEEFGLGGPWPIPLPYDNCLRKVFKYVSIMYAVELNAFIGDNLYTQSTFWFFGRGVTPVFLKVYPDLVKDDLDGLDWGKITVDALEKEAERFLKDDMPKFAANIVENLITEIMKKMIESLIPFKPPSCGGGGEGGGEGEEDDDAGPAAAIKKFAKEFLQDVLKEFGGIVQRSFQKVLLTMKNDVYSKLDSGDSEYSLKRQLPGVAVRAGGEINIGKEATSMLATGLFLAKGNITIESNETIGAVISTDGNVNVQKFSHYPYFERISVYQPKQNVSIWESVGTIVPPEGSNAGFVGGTWVKRLAEGMR